MAWYDKVADYASVAMPLWAAGIQGAKALGNYAGGKDVKLFGADTSYTPPGAPGAVSETTRLTPEQQAAFSPMNNPAISGAFNPYNNPHFAGAAQDAGRYGEQGQANQNTADQRLLDGYSGPSVPITPDAVRANNPNANTAASGAGIDRAVGLLGNTQDSRGMQTDVYGRAMDWANGNMPSVGVDMANEAGVRANEQFQRAGSEANQAYGTSAAGAARAYADSLAAQGYATQQAGVNAARQTGDAASDAVLRQAALVSGARGGNMGMALRAGLGGAAMQSADANRQGARLMSDANAQASAQAAAGQRAAQNAALMSNLATQGTQERAGFAASAAEQAARFQAAQIASGEQQGALGVAAGQANAIQGGDVATTNAATNLANTGVAVDSMINDVNTANANRSAQVDMFNSGQGFNAQTFGQQMGLNYDQLNSGNLNQVANRGAGAAQFGIGTQAGMAGQATQAQQNLALQQIMGNQQLAQMFMGLDEAAKQRMLETYAIQQGQATARRGQNIGLFGGGASAMGAIGAGVMTMSDRRAKKDIKRTAVPDFRKAGSYSYSYKDPDAPGAAPGKHSGPMAQELPKDVITKGPDGLMRVDIGRLALQTAAALGELQRKSDAA